MTYEDIFKKLGIHLQALVWMDRQVKLEKPETSIDIPTKDLRGLLEKDLVQMKIKVAEELMELVKKGQLDPVTMNAVVNKHTN